MRLLALCFRCRSSSRTRSQRWLSPFSISIWPLVTSASWLLATWSGRTSGKDLAGIVTAILACGPAGGSVAKGMKKISYQRLPVSARDHPAGDLALSPVHAELS